jgi:transposase-like protein
MDPTMTFCPNRHCHARGHIGQGNIGIHFRKEQRFICHECHKTFSATKGTAFYRLRTSAETVVLIVTLLAHGCPLQAIVAAFGFDERTVADWWARSGRQGQAVHEYLVEQPRDLGQVQADEIRVKKQGGIVWMALAMMVKTRLWLGGEVSAARPAPDPAADRAGEALCGTASPVGLYRWLGSLHPGHSGDLSRPHTYGQGRPATAAAVAPCLDRPSRQALRAATGGRDRSPYCGWHAGTCGDASTPLARRRDDQHGVHRTAQRDVPGTPRTAGASVPGAGPSDPDTARGDVRGGHGL